MTKLAGGKQKRWNFNFNSTIDFVIGSPTIIKKRWKSDDGDSKKILIKDSVLINLSVFSGLKVWRHKFTKINQQ